ncbi:hypothetical protein [Propionibacterium sp.]|uniref:hypothetical protein n=1 Tax=Propionibacterium sp. TaxID=1977903 RepID=UPI0039EAEEE0
MKGTPVSHVWFTADPHFGHAKVAHMRGFADPQAMNGEICQTWRRQVGPDDAVYLLGDIADSDPHEALAVLATLPGRKHLVAGNHDDVHPLHDTRFAHADMHAWLEVFETITTFRLMKIEGVPVLLSHFPYAAWGDGLFRDGARYDQFRLPDLGTALLHGHTHGAERAHGHSFHIGWDAWHELVPEQSVAAWLRSEELLEMSPEVA